MLYYEGSKQNEIILFVFESDKAPKFIVEKTKSNWRIISVISEGKNSSAHTGF